MIISCLLNVRGSQIDNCDIELYSVAVKFNVTLIHGHSTMLHELTMLHINLIELDRAVVAFADEVLKPTSGVLVMKCSRGGEGTIPGSFHSIRASTKEGTRRKI